MDYIRTLERIVAWARHEDNVRAVVLAESAAAGLEHPLSDRDIELHVKHVAAPESDDSWWNKLGEVLAVERLENAENQPTRLIYYVGGKIDFTLIETQKAKDQYASPFKVLLDKDKSTSGFIHVPLPREAPDQDLFDECCNWASAAILMTTKAIVRDEPWSQMIREYSLKTELLRMIEWDHIMRYGSEYDVRYLGTHLRQWMDPDIQRKVDACAAVYGRNNRHALAASLALFDELARRVAIGLGITPFPMQSIESEVAHILNR